MTPVLVSARARVIATSGSRRYLGRRASVIGYGPRAPAFYTRKAALG